MSSAARHVGLETVHDLLARPERPHAEVIAGEIVEKATPSADHANAQTGLIGYLAPRFHRSRGDDERPGGWWILTEALVELEPHEVYQPDVSGWRRNRVPERPRDTVIRLAADWVCEILSPSNARYDVVDKLRVYRRNGIAHYWIIDPTAETLTAYRLQDGEYVVALTARRGERVRAEPFAEVELAIGILFGDDDELRTA